MEPQKNSSKKIMIDFIVLNKAHTGFFMEVGLQEAIHIAVVFKTAKK